MPKMKTKKAAAKRFGVTASGKFKRPQATKHHKLGKKSPGKKRRLRGSVLVDKTDHARVKRMLPYA